MVEAVLRPAGRAHRALHVAAPGRLRGAHPGRRPHDPARRGRRAGRRAAGRRSSRAGIALTHFEFSHAPRVRVVRPHRGRASAVVEVGLGGRLDATNTVRPGRDGHHVDRARSRGVARPRELRQIAFEKAGIAKPGVPLVVGRVPAEARRGRSPRTRPTSARRSWCGPGTTARSRNPRRARVPRPGRRRRGDGLALGARRRVPASTTPRWRSCSSPQLRDAVPATADAVRAGLAAVQWPGRLAVVAGARRWCVVDGAHNPAGVAALAARAARPRRRPPARRWCSPSWPTRPGRRCSSAPAARAARWSSTRVGRRGLDPGAHRRRDGRRACRCAWSSTRARRCDAPSSARRPTTPCWSPARSSSSARRTRRSRPACRSFEPWHGWGRVMLENRLDDGPARAQVEAGWGLGRDACSRSSRLALAAEPTPAEVRVLLDPGPLPTRSVTVRATPDDGIDDRTVGAQARPPGRGRRAAARRSSDEMHARAARAGHRADPRSSRSPTTS